MCIRDSFRTAENVEGISPDEGQPPAKPMGDDVIAIWSKQAQKIDNYNSPDFIRCNKDYYGGEPMADDFVLGSRVLRRGDAGSDVELTQNLLKVLPEPMGTQTVSYTHLRLQSVP